jgi:ABC-type transporter Mla subunit MlaD
MKKFLILMLAIILIFAMPVAVFAAEGDTSAPEQTDTDFPSVDEIVAYVQAHLEEISVIITMIVTIIYNVRKNTKIDKSVTTLNNNAVTVATDSKEAIDKALASIAETAATVSGYKKEIADLLEEVRQNAEEKQALEKTLADVTAHLKTAKLANVEFANELAELLVLANIPNSVKDELFARHRAAVASIAEAEITEVVDDESAEETVNAEAA